MSITSPSRSADDKDVYYPESDGEPLAETTIHVQTIIWLFEALQDHFASVPDVFVAADLFWYWEVGNPDAKKAPDVMVVKGVPRGDRRSFFSWRENNAVPCTIFEIASKGTWRENLYEKRRLYEKLGVREYFIFDPEQEYLRPPLLGFRRSEQGIYVPLEADDQERMKSEELGLFMRPEGTMLRLYDSLTAKPILTREEIALQERQRVEELEAEVARLRALLEQSRPDQPPRE